MKGELWNMIAGGECYLLQNRGTNIDDWWAIGASKCDGVFQHVGFNVITRETKCPIDLSIVDRVMESVEKVNARNPQALNDELWNDPNFRLTVQKWLYDEHVKGKGGE